MVEIILRHFGGDREAAARYCERIAANGGPLTAEYEALAQAIRSRS